MEREKIRTLIECATSFEKANEILEKYTDYTTDAERIAYLQGMFDCKIVGRKIEDVHTDYVALLTSVIDNKWRG